MSLYARSKCVDDDECHDEKIECSRPEYYEEGDHEGRDD